MPKASSRNSRSRASALQLLCHYRSRDELLIAFSNTHVYDEPMLTFPSTSGMKSSALRLEVVTDGHFNRDDKSRYVFQNSNEAVPILRTNMAEARAVVDECLGRLRDPVRAARRRENPNSSAESIIVVTFNRPQMDLITAMFRNDDPDLFEQATSEWVDEETGIKQEPQLKIRNLENVQGDEAETVIFSVAFSAAKNGRFPSTLVLSRSRAASEGSMWQSHGAAGDARLFLVLAR